MSHNKSSAFLNNGEFHCFTDLIYFWQRFEPTAKTLAWEMSEEKTLQTRMTKLRP